MRRNRLASQFAWLSAGRLVGALLQAATMLLLARDAGPHNFGLFSAVFGAAVVFQTAFDAGIATMVVKERATDPASPYIGSSLHLTDRLALAILIASALPLAFLGLFVDHLYLLMLPLSVWAASERHSDTWLSVTMADGEARINTQTLLIKRTLVLLIYLGAVFVGVDAILAFSAAMAGTAFVALVVVRKIVSSRVSFDLPRLGAREILTISWPFWLNSLGTQARNLDAVVVSIVAGPLHAGFYAATSRATGPLRILSTSLAAVLLPASTTAKRREIRRLLRLVAIVGVVSATIFSSLILIVPAAVNLLLGAEYVGAVLPLQIALVGLPFAAMSSLLGSILQGMNRQFFVAKTAVATTLLCLLFVGAGGAFAGATGAAIALSISFLIQATILGCCANLWLLRTRGKRSKEKYIQIQGKRIKN
ncbi:oligosaccharide flippase family protein [Arthrobacter sp. NPDC093139]|uniref:oligosaccharide flippase family protein n=1 Tax=Arthrobacter sp. NPDC093139 TaxID=3363945 RepID=UPI003822240A